MNVYTGGQLTDLSQCNIPQIARRWGRPVFLSAGNSWRPLIITKKNLAIVTDHRSEGKGRWVLQPSRFSNFSVYQSQMESPLKHRLLGLTPEILFQLVQGRAHICISPRQCYWHLSVVKPWAALLAVLMNTVCKGLRARELGLSWEVFGVTSVNTIAGHLDRN